MFGRAVLGVDPGLAATGFAIVGIRDGRPEVSWAYTLRTPAGLPEPLRLRLVHAQVVDAISEHHPGAVAIERVMWGRNVGSAMTVARATGVAMLAAADAGLPVEEYAPLEVKMAVAGVGNAGKDQVRLALARLHGLAAVPEQRDAADAVAVALCHLQQARLRDVVQIGGGR